MRHKTTDWRGRLAAFALLFGCAMLALTYAAPAQAKPQAKMHKVVFEMSVDGMAKWESVVRNAANLQKTFGTRNTRIEIVAHGKGIGLVLSKTSQANPTLKKMIQELHQSGVVFAACNNTLQRMKIAKSDLLQVAVVVDSGVAEVVRKQEAGWTYIKSG